MQDIHPPTTSELDPPAAADKPRIELRRTRNFGALINVVFEFCRKNAKPLMASIGLIVGPTLVVATIASILVMSRMLGNESYTNSDSFDGLLSVYREAWGVIVLSTIAGILTTVVMITVIAGYIRQYVDRAPNEITVKDVWEEVRYSFGRVLLTSIAAMIVTMLPMLIFVGFAAASESVPLIVLAVFLSAIPTIYIGTCMSIVVPLRLEEEIGLFASIRRSMYLTRGRWWFSFWVYVVMTFVVMLVSAVFQIPIQIATVMASFSGSEPAIPILVIGVAISTVGSYLLYSVLIATCSINYYNLVEGKEGVGLIDRINAIGGSTEFDSIPNDASRF